MLGACLCAFAIFATLREKTLRVTVAVLLQLAIEGFAADAEGAGGVGFVAFGVVERGFGIEHDVAVSGHPELVGAVVGAHGDGKGERLVGRQTGQIVLRVLKGEKPGDIAVAGIEITELVVNPGAAEAMGITIPAAVLAKAKEVVN